MGLRTWLRRIGDDGVARLARTRPLPWWGAVLVGAVFAGVLLVLRKALEPLYGDITGFMILLPAVMAAGLAGGASAGLAAVIVCLVGGWALVGLETPGAGWNTTLGRVATANFVIVGVFTAFLSASLRRTVGRLDASLSDIQRTSQTIQAADQSRRRTEAELQAMVAQASAGIVRLDLDGKVISANARFAEIIGRPVDQVVGIRTVDVTHPDDVDPTLNILTSVSGGESGRQLEKRYIRPDGRIVWALTSLAPLMADSGEPEGSIAVVVDITDAKTAEGALRESESRFRMMADTAPSPVWLTNEAGEVEFVNAALEAFYGRPAAEILGHVWRAAIHPDDVADVAAIQGRARPQHLPYAFECRFRRADAAWRWMRVTVSPRFADGVFKGYVGLSFDVTDSREALDALAALEQRQTFLLDLSDRLRDMQLPVEIMAEAESALGRRLDLRRVAFGEMDEAAGLYRIHHAWSPDGGPTDATLPIADFGPVSDAIQQGRTVVVRDVALDPLTRGSREAHAAQDALAFVNTPLMRAGALRAFMTVTSDRPRDWSADEVALIEDVAERAWSEVERTRAGAEVIESEARFRTIADTAPVLIWVTGPDRRRAFVNQAYVAFYGSTYDEALTATWQDVLHHEDYERVIAESVVGESTGEPFSLEARYRRHDGDYRWLKSFSRPRRGAGGELAGFVGVAFDVTDARKAEADLMLINELLEERVEAALEEKARAEADLMHAQRLEAVGRLTGGVAHDFNNLLTVVIGALDMMLKRPEDTARIRKLGEAALGAARRGEGLTHQLLAFSRRQALRPEAVDLNTLIEDASPLLKRAVGETIVFETRLKRGGARALVDVAQFEAVLLNLLVNARDALASRKSAKVVIRTETVAVQAGEVADLPAGSYVRVSVRDNGEGMDPATLARVFEPFFTTKPVGKGTGLGLSQVYGFARQSGGAVQVSSTPGKGAAIQLYLPPLADDARLDSRDPVAVSGADLQGVTVLLVEDDPAVSAVALELLEGFGMKTRAVMTGPDALSALGRHTYDMMVTDVVMPGGMTGIELAKICAERHPDLRILLTSGYAGDDVDTALVDAPWRLLPKPYSAEQLKSALAELSA